jgi:hypothetical protein
MMAGHTKKPQRQEAFLAALLTQPTIALAAKAASISEATAARWLREPEFAHRYRKAKERMVGEAISFLQQSMVAAVAVLRQTMTADNTKPAQKVMAARTILELGLRTYELQELEARITALEAAQEGAR